MLNELYKKHPFIYCINEKYYAMGQRVCAECPSNIVGLSGPYRIYKEALNKEMSQLDAWKIVHKLMFRAEYVRDNIDGDNKTSFSEKLEKLNFSENEKKELENQLLDFINFWKKHRLYEICK